MRVAIIAYNTLQEATDKGLVWDDPASLNVWFNPGGGFEYSLVFVPFGRSDQDHMITDKVRYVEWDFPRTPRWMMLFRIPKFVFLAVWFLNRSIGRDRVDVVRCNGPHLPAMIGWLLRRTRSVPMALFIEAFWERTLPSQSAIPAPIRGILPFWYRIAYRSFDAYCGTPSVDPPYYVALGMPAAKITRWTHELDLDSLARRSKNVRLSDAIERTQHPRLVAVGRLHPEKHPEDIVQVLAIVRRRYRAASLILVGDGPMREELEMLARSLDVSDGILFTGSVNQGEGFAIVSACDVYVAPMQGNALVEALAAGAPIVAYDHAWHRKLVDDRKTGILTAYRDVEKMAAAVCEILSDPDLIASLSENAKAVAWQMHGPAVVAEKLRDVFERAANSSLRPSHADAAVRGIGEGG